MYSSDARRYPLHPVRRQGQKGIRDSKTARAPSAPIMSLRNMDIPPCSSSNLKLSCSVRRPARHHIQTLSQLTSLLMPADRRIKRGRVRISGSGPRTWPAVSRRAVEQPDQRQQRREAHGEHHDHDPSFIHILHCRRRGKSKSWLAPHMSKKQKP